MHAAYDQAVSGVVKTMYCRNCGYMLVNITSESCPECGRHFDPLDPRSYDSSLSRRHRSRLVRLTLVGLLVGMALYLSSYLVLIDAAPFFVRTTNSIQIQASGGMTVTPTDEGFAIVLSAKPKYRIGGAWARFLFAPLHKLDRRIRPEMWELRLQRPQADVEKSANQ